MRYPGGKSKLYQNIINLMPRHRVYIETHLGGGAVLRHKRPAEINIGIDVDPRVIAVWQTQCSPHRLICQKGEEFLASYRFTGDELVYADPPYHPETRRRPKVYRHDYSTVEHLRLLELLKSLHCMVMISGYPHESYDSLLRDWTRHEFAGTSHAGRRTECIWVNFHPGPLHDDRYLGKTFRDRQTIKRRRQRWQERFRREPLEIQSALLMDLQSIHNAEISA